MDLTALLIVAAAVAIAAFVQATSGLGFALIVAPVMGLFAPALLPACVLLLMLPLNAYVVWRERTAIDRGGATWITFGRLVGTFGGLWIVLVLSAHALNILVGVVTILAAFTTLLLPAFHAGRSAFVAAGLVTGITETATGIGGPPLALVYQHHPPPVLRSTIAVCFLIGQLISLALLAIAHKVQTTALASTALLLPALVLGALLSRYVHRRVDGKGLRVFVLLFAIVSGVVLLVRA